MINEEIKKKLVLLKHRTSNEQDDEFCRLVYSIQSYDINTARFLISLLSDKEDSNVLECVVCVLEGMDKDVIIDSFLLELTQLIKNEKEWANNLCSMIIENYGNYFIDKIKLATDSQREAILMIIRADDKFLDEVENADKVWRFLSEKSKRGRSEPPPV